MPIANKYNHKVGHNAPNKNFTSPPYGPYHPLSLVSDRSGENINLDELDMDLNLNDEFWNGLNKSEATTPCDDDQCPSRPESAASDYDGRSSHEADGVVWAKPMDDGFKVVKRN